MRISVAAAALAGALAAPSAWAQENPAPREIVIQANNPELLGKFSIDTSIPDTPGFAIIGASPATVIDPSAEPVTFATLSPFLDEDNNLKTGFAVGGSPYWWFNQGKLIVDYQNKTKTGWLERVMARTSLSAAFVDGGDDGADKAGFGFSTDLLDDSDYRLDGALQQCVKDRYAPLSSAQRPNSTALNDFKQLAEEQLRLETPGVAPGAVAINTRATALVQAWRKGLDLEALAAKFQTGVKDCQAEAAKRYLYKPSWTIAAAVAVDVDDSDVLEGDGNGGAVWTAYRVPFGEAPAKVAEAQAPYATFFGKYQFDRAETISNVEVESNAGTAGIVGGFESVTMKASFQLGYQWVDYDSNTLNLDEDSYSVYSLSYSHKLQDGVWLNLDIGSTGERDAVANDRAEYVKLTLSYKVG